MSNEEIKKFIKIAINNSKLGRFEHDNKGRLKMIGMRVDGVFLEKQLNMLLEIMG